MSQSDIDFSQPISAILSESTRQVHETVEESAAAVSILRGQLSQDDYTRFQMMLWHIYK
jgi:heme oxygenase